jgi:hypothetical protein
MTVPPINRRIVCIVNRESTLLAAVLSSYLSYPGEYLPLFTFPSIAEATRRESTIDDDDFIPMIVGLEGAVKINNAIARLGGRDYVVLAGISAAQKGYFRSFGKAKIVEIASIGEVADKLAVIGISKSSDLRCKPSQVFVGLHLAQRNDQCLVIDDTVAELSVAPLGKDGLVVIEQDIESADTVIAVNYAHSIDADVAFVAALGRDERRQTLDFLHEWWSGDGAAFEQVAAKVDQRVGTIDFTAYHFATFFTTGLPYSLVLENLIPFSAVDLSLRPDLFVVNCILAEANEPFGSALVFCHDDFVTSGEARWLVEWLERKATIVRVLAGRDAVVYNLDYNAQHFPYDLLHIVSHGGLMSGNAVRQTFVDRDGNAHVVEYDEVVSFEVRPGRKKIGVQPLRIFRTLDGFVWRSAELAAQHLPSYVFTDLHKAIAAWENRAQTATQTQKDNIAASRAILCNDSFHQGTFRSLAAYTSPIIFNNACWSWSDIASFFLSSGARGYIGTYWAISNAVAVTGAKAFYEATINATTMEAVHRANVAIAATDDANIFMYWGLHFSTLSSGRNRAYNLERVLHALVDELFLLIDHIPDITAPDVLTNNFDAIRLIRQDLRTKFRVGNRVDLEDEVATRLVDAIRRLRAQRRAALAKAPASP